MPVKAATSWPILKFIQVAVVILIIPCTMFLYNISVDAALTQQRLDSVEASRCTDQDCTELQTSIEHLKRDKVDNIDFIEFRIATENLIISVGKLEVAVDALTEKIRKIK